MDRVPACARALARAGDRRDGRRRAGNGWGQHANHPQRRRRRRSRARLLASRAHRACPRFVGSAARAPHLRPGPPHQRMPHKAVPRETGGAQRGCGKRLPRPVPATLHGGRPRVPCTLHATGAPPARLRARQRQRCRRSGAMLWWAASLQHGRSNGAGMLPTVAWGIDELLQRLLGRLGRGRGKKVTETVRQPNPTGWEQIKTRVVCTRRRMAASRGRGRGRGEGGRQREGERRRGSVWDGPEAAEGAGTTVPVQQARASGGV